MIETIKEFEPEVYCIMYVIKNETMYSFALQKYNSVYNSYGFFFKGHMYTCMHDGKLI